VASRTVPTGAAYATLSAHQARHMRASAHESGRVDEAGENCCAERNCPTALRVARRAERQEGIVKESQLRDIGLDRFAVRRWVAAGRLHREYPGVYAVGHRTLSMKGKLVAALFYCGQGAALCDRSGAHWWALIERPPAEIHVCARHHRTPRPGLVLHRPRVLDRVLHHQLPVTPVARTLLDLATGASVGELRKALAEADYRGLLDLEQLRSVTGRGRPGSARLRAALEAHLPALAKTETPLEDGFLLLCERFGLPLPEPNVWIGPYRVDALWREARVVVELDGRDAHSSEARRLTDHERDLHLRHLGYVIRRYSWHQVFARAAAVAADARRTLQARRSG